MIIGPPPKFYETRDNLQLDFTEFETTVDGTFDGDRSPTPGPAARRPLHL
jgi:hypothetical protein